MQVEPGKVSAIAWERDPTPPATCWVASACSRSRAAGPGRREDERGFPLASTVRLLVVVSALGASLLSLTDSIGGAGGEAVPTGSATSFVVGHDGKGIHCAGEPVTVTACLPDGSIDTGYADAVTLDTRIGRGTWSNGAGNLGSFGDATADDGLASYTFDPADEGVATFVLSYPEGPPFLDVDVFQTSNAGIRDDDSEGTLEFGPSGFTLTASPLPDPPPSPIADPIPAQTAGTGFLLHLTAYGQTPTDPECAVVESYAGAHLLRLWSSYIDPATGTHQITIDGSAIATSEAAAALQAVAFAAGRASVAARYEGVGVIQIHVKDDGVSEPPGGIAGATNPFAVRPADRAITRVTRVHGSPIGHATFGIFAGDDPVIYLREVY